MPLLSRKRSQGTKLWLQPHATPGYGIVIVLWLSIPTSLCGSTIIRPAHHGFIFGHAGSCWRFSDWRVLMSVIQTIPTGIHPLVPDTVASSSGTSSRVHSTVGDMSHPRMQGRHWWLCSVLTDCPWVRIPKHAAIMHGDEFKTDGKTESIIPSLWKVAILSRFFVDSTPDFFAALVLCL